nr:MAG TPA_asm: hypothetical protein [Bacteriophage sp.]
MVEDVILAQELLVFHLHIVSHLIEFLLVMTTSSVIQHTLRFFLRLTVFSATSLLRISFSVEYTNL